MFLEEQIAMMHKQGTKKRNYTVPFSFFIDVMEKAVTKECVREEFYLKEKIYDYVMESMEKALEGLC